MVLGMLSSHTFWFWVSRLGESPIVLPVALALMLLFVVIAFNAPVRNWALALGMAGLLTAASKIAFMGWGLGIATLDFTGFSGHAMLSAAIYPVLGHVFARRRHGSKAWWGAAMGLGLAALIAVSRVTTHAHSVSETVAGFLLGCSASAFAVGFMSPDRLRVPRWAWVGAAAWLVLMPMVAMPFSTHGAVIKVALMLSQRQQPYQRSDLHHLEPRQRGMGGLRTTVSAKPLAQ